MKTKSTIMALILVTGLTMMGCSSNSQGGTETGTTDTGDDSGGGSDATNPSLSASLRLSTEASSQAGLVGQNSAAGLLSLKYYITSITICEDMELSGTAFNNPTGCLEIYAGNQEDPNYAYELDEDFAPFADVARQSDEGFVDLMDDTDRATLNTTKTLSSDDVRSYSYGYITWYLPVKITAEVDMGDGVVYRTKDGSTVTVDPDQSPITTANGNFAEVSTAEEAVVVLGNGGSWFRFQNPFVISQQDIDDNVEFDLDLVFNPEGLIKAYSSGIGGCGGCILVDNADNQLLVPMINLTPVPHGASENIVKEAYVATVQSGSDNFDIRIELYSIQNDPERTIYGVDTATLINGDTTTAVSPFPKVSFLETAEDGTLTLQNHNGSDGVLISGFERQTEEDASFSATLHCDSQADGAFSFDQCADGTTQEITFTLESIAEL